jgi:hypothetical protein
MQEVTAFYYIGTELEPRQATVQTHCAEKESIKHPVPYLVYKDSRKEAAEALRQDHTDLLNIPCNSSGVLHDKVDIPDQKAANGGMID